MSRKPKEKINLQYALWVVRQGELVTADSDIFENFVNSLVRVKIDKRDNAGKFVRFHKNKWRVLLSHHKYKGDQIDLINLNSLNSNETLSTEGLENFITKIGHSKMIKIGDRKVKFVPLPKFWSAKDDEESCPDRKTDQIPGEEQTLAEAFEMQLEEFKKTLEKADSEKM